MFRNINKPQHPSCEITGKHGRCGDFPPASKTLQIPRSGTGVVFKSAAKSSKHSYLVSAASETSACISSVCSANGFRTRSYDSSSLKDRHHEHSQPSNRCRNASDVRRCRLHNLNYRIGIGSEVYVTNRRSISSAIPHIEFLQVSQLGTNDEPWSLRTMIVEGSQQEPISFRGSSLGMHCPQGSRLEYVE